MEKRSSHDDSEAQSPLSNVQDEAQKVLASATDTAPMTDEEERALLRKIDLRIIPMLWVTTGLQYADKSSLSTAALFGLIQALQLFSVTLTGLDTYRYSLVAMIFSVGYICGVLPLAAIAQRFRTGQICGIYVIIWGVVAILTPLCKSFEGIMAQRFFLGFMESGVSPAFLSILSMWYTKREQSIRAPIIYSANGYFIMPILLVGYGIVTVGPARNAWHNIYYFLGALTIAWGCVVVWILPDDPIRAKFLTERERFIAVERLRANQAGITNKHFKGKQALQALADPKVLLLALAMFCLCSPSGAVGSFSPLVLQRVYGATPRRTLLLLLPSAAVGGTSSLLAGIIAFKIPNARCAAVAIFAVVCLIGAALEWRLPLTNKQGILAGLYMMSAYAGSLGTITGLATSNVAGATKKSVLGSLVFLMLNLANIASPFFFLREEQPRYPTGFRTTLALMSAGVGLTGVYWALCLRENRKRDADLAKTGGYAQDNAFTDMTDIENKAFRYSL